MDVAQSKAQNPTQELPYKSAILSSLHNNGYIHIPALITPSSELFHALRKASTSLTERARSGSWPHVRTLPKQFPPWSAADAPEHGIWGVQHLLHPSLPSAERDVFAEGYFSDEIIAVTMIILGLMPDSRADSIDNEQLVMELWNLLVTPGTATQGKDFELCWHRDDVSPELTGSAEEHALGLESGKERVYTHTQFNLSLANEDDSSLIVVPGSHARARTEEEVKLMRDDPYHPRLPGQEIVTLKPGDVVFYDNNILHRGVYSGSKQRYTLHGSFSRKGAANERARNVLQHGVGKWIDKCDFDNLDIRLRNRAEVMKSGLVQMGREGGWTGDYSLKG